MPLPATNTTQKADNIDEVNTSLSTILDPSIEIGPDRVVTDRGRGDTGCVFVGLADIDVLERAAGIRLNRGAEGGIFDPALVKLLATAYKLGEPEIESLGPKIMSEGSKTSYTNISDVAKACEHNLQVMIYIYIYREREIYLP
jgi:hypothetical protein